MNQTSTQIVSEQANAPHDAAEAVRLFVDILDAEKSLALRADLEGLESITDIKREALLELSRFSLDDVTHAEISRRAKENILLMRHIAAFFKSLTVDDGSSTYTTAGTRNQAMFGRPRGAL